MPTAKPKRQKRLVQRGERAGKPARGKHNGHAAVVPPGERGGKSTAQIELPQTLVRARVITDGSPQRIRFSNTDKVFFPDARVTKGQVLEYYERISPWLLPYLRNRPITIERYPDGVAGRHPAHFWQKNTPDYYPSWITRVELPTEGGKLVQYPMVNDVETLLYLVNQGALTFHVNFSTVEDLAHPDFVLFDLDLGRGQMADLVTVALELHRRSEACSVGCMLKTSGKTGLHVIAPWQKGTYDEARAWATRIAAEVAAKLPQIATTQRRKEKRGRRIYIDVMQNALGHHAVPPYVIRATPTATVSAPLDWDELGPRLEPKRFTIKTIFDRFKR